MKMKRALAAAARRRQHQAAPAAGACTAAPAPLTSCRSLPPPSALITNRIGYSVNLLSERRQLGLLKSHLDNVGRTAGSIETLAPAESPTAAARSAAACSSAPGPPAVSTPEGRPTTSETADARLKISPHNICLSFQVPYRRLIVRVQASTQQVPASGNVWAGASGHAERAPGGAAPHLVPQRHRHVRRSHQHYSRNQIQPEAHPAAAIKAVRASAMQTRPHVGVLLLRQQDAILAISGSVQSER